MSLKKIVQVKADKWFRLRDMFVYGVILAVVALLLAVVLTREKSALQGIRILIDNEIVFEYDFTAQKYEIVKEECIEIVSDGEETLLLTVWTGDGAYNDVTVYKSGSVTVTGANCPGKDCVNMPAIQDSSGWISCWTHRLWIIPYGYDADDGNLIL